MQINIQVEGIRQLQKKLKVTADKLKNMRQFWSSVGLYVQKQTIKERFDKEQSPEGQKWKPLAPATVKRRLKRHKKGNMKILQDTGELRRNISHPTALQVGDSYVRFGTKLKYARTHQFGRGKIPARPFLGVNESEKKHITSMFRQYLKRNILGG